VGASDDFGSLLVVLLFLLTVLGLLAWGIKLAAGDARRRGKSAVLVCIACVLFFPWGLVAWVLFRPDPIDKRKNGFNLENYRVR
jgi:hypothetical protein